MAYRWTTHFEKSREERLLFKDTVVGNEVALAYDLVCRVRGSGDRLGCAVVNKLLVFRGELGGESVHWRNRRVRFPVRQCANQNQQMSKSDQRNFQRRSRKQALILVCMHIDSVIICCPSPDGHVQYGYMRLFRVVVNHYNKMSRSRQPKLAGDAIKSLSCSSFHDGTHQGLEVTRTSLVLYPQRGMADYSDVWVGFVLSTSVEHTAIPPFLVLQYLKQSL